MAKKGQTLTDEHKAKISAGLKGHAPSPKAIAAMQAVNRGSHLSEERKHRLSQAAIARSYDSERLARRFWKKVQVAGPTECWEWKACAQNKGYGRVGIRGDVHMASRVAYELFHEEPIPAGLGVLHECDNPPCCNPAHLFLGTPAANMADMLAKNRQRFPGAKNPRRGSTHLAAKLTENDVLAMLEMRHNGIMNKDIACKFGISAGHASALCNGKFWVHVRLKDHPP